MLTRLLAGLAFVLVLIYAGDTMFYVLRSHRNAANGTVQVSLVTAVTLKADKLAYYPEGTTEVPCATALFPHGGMNPCWYVRRHPELVVTY